MNSLFWTETHSSHSANPQIFFFLSLNRKALATISFSFFTQPQSHPLSRVKLKIKPSICSRYYLPFLPIQLKGPVPTNFARHTTFLSCHPAQKPTDFGGVGLILSKSISTNPLMEHTFNPNRSKSVSSKFYHQGKLTPIKENPLSDWSATTSDWSGFFLDDRIEQIGEGMDFKCGPTDGFIERWAKKIL